MNPLKNGVTAQKGLTKTTKFKIEKDIPISQKKPTKHFNKKD